MDSGKRGGTFASGIKGDWEWHIIKFRIAMKGQEGAGSLALMMTAMMVVAQPEMS